MERLFIRVLQMSLAGAVVILGVLLLRLLMRRSPGRFRYPLWIVPAFRLCVPLSLTSPVSLFRLLRSGRTEGFVLPGPHTDLPEPGIGIQGKSPGTAQRRAGLHGPAQVAGIDRVQVYVPEPLGQRLHLPAAEIRQIAVIPALHPAVEIALRLPVTDEIDGGHPTRPPVCRSGPAPR